MAGNWLGVPVGWAVSPANGAGVSGRRFLVTAPNKRRWECSSLEGWILRDLVKALAKAGLCADGSSIHEPLPADAIPSDLREIEQRKCRDCLRVRELEHYDGGARSCRGCVRRRCSARPGQPRISRKDLGPCPACAELCPVTRLEFVPGIDGPACSSCADEARAATVRAADVVVALARPEPARPPAPAPLGELRLPQIRDFGRLRRLLQLVASGVTSTRALGEAMGAGPKSAARHACFYRQAAEVLGLLEQRSWTVTELGQRFLAAAPGSDDERSVLRQAIAGAPLGPLVEAVLVTRAPDLHAVVEQVTALLPGLARSTILRRVRDTLSWRAALGLAPVARAKRKAASRPAQLDLWADGPRASVGVRDAVPATVDFSDYDRVHAVMQTGF